MSENTQRVYLCVATMLAVFSSSSLAADWYVDQASCPGPGTGTAGDPFCTITAAVGAASGGDTIHIAPGTYVENVTLDEDLTLIGTAGQEVTIIDGNGSGDVVTVVRGRDVELTGLTITNGNRGVKCNPSGSPNQTVLTMTNSTVSGNSSLDISSNAVTGGLGIYLPYTKATLRNVEVSSNYKRMGVMSTYRTRGGGIWAKSAFGAPPTELTILNSTITSNEIHSTSLNLSSGEGAGIYVGYYCSLTMVNSTVARNTLRLTVPSYAAGVWDRSQTTRIDNSIISHNSTYLFGNQDVFTYGSTSVANSNTGHSYYHGYAAMPGPGNISADPQFVSLSSVALSPSSPCIDTGDSTLLLSALAAAGVPDPTQVSTDIAGAPRFQNADFSFALGVPKKVDMGAHEFSNVYLDGSFDGAPNFDLKLDTYGTAGLPAVVIFGFGSGALRVAPFGVFYFSLFQPWQIIQSGTLVGSPGLSLTIHVPLGIAPLPLYFQSIVLDPLSLTGNSSNLEEVVIFH